MLEDDWRENWNGWKRNWSRLRILRKSILIEHRFRKSLKTGERNSILGQRRIHHLFRVRSDNWSLNH